MPPINGDSMSENKIVIVIIIVIIIVVVMIMDPSHRMPPDHALASFRQIQHGVSCATSFIFAS